jgi:hypothetical protein
MASKSGGGSKGGGGSKSGGSGSNYRSSVSGEYITKKEADRNPRESEKERRK